MQARAKRSVTCTAGLCPVESAGTWAACTRFSRDGFQKSSEWLTDIGVLTARPAAVVVFALYASAWIVFGNGLEWHSLATLATWGMTLVIQRAEHRDTQAIHAKLDELLKADGAASKQDHEDRREGR